MLYLLLFLSSLFIEGILVTGNDYHDISDWTSSVQAANRLQHLKYNTVANVSWKWQPLRAAPTISSNYGAASLSGPQHREDMQFIGVGPITMAPWNGNFANSTMRIRTDNGTNHQFPSNFTTVHVERASWTPCEGVRRGQVACRRIENSALNHFETCTAVNSVGVRRDHRSVIQKWNFFPPRYFSPGASIAPLVLDLFLDGPYFFRCDHNPITTWSHQCGWGTEIPVNRTNFTRWIDTNSNPNLTLMWSQPSNETRNASWRKTHPTWAVSALWTTVIANTSKQQSRIAGGNVPECQVTSIIKGYDYDNVDNYTGFGFNATAVIMPTTQNFSCTLWWATAVDYTKQGALAILMQAVAPEFQFGANASIENKAENGEDQKQSYLREHQRKNVVKVTQDVYNDICSEWLDSFGQAFNPNPGHHFSGNLPLLETDDKKIEALYGWAVTALIAMEREMLPAGPRVFPASEGESNSFSGKADMGGSGQYIWDMSFNSVTHSLLEPEGAKRMLRHILSNQNFFSHPFNTPENWDADEKYPSTTPAGFYCFDDMATFFYIQNYVSNTGDIAFLTEQVPNFPDCEIREDCDDPSHTTRTPLESLRRLAWAWREFNVSDQSPYLVNYGNNKRAFLEVISTYRGVVPSINAANAGMLLSLARLLETVPSLPRAHPNEIQELRGNATMIAKAVVDYLYRPDGGWFFPVQTNESNGTEVKAITETIYIPIFAGLVGANATTQHSVLSTQFPLPGYVREGMVKLMRDEMLANGWPRAISLRDPTMSRINCMGGMAGLKNPGASDGVPTCNITDLVRMRSDWTGTGAYIGVAGATIDAMATVEQAFDTALFLLHNYSIVADPDLGTMPAQGIVVTIPPFMIQYLHNNSNFVPPSRAFAGSFPEFFDEPDWPFWTWPRTSRNVQSSASSIVDAVIRTLFGWRPDWGTLWVEDVHDEIQIQSAINQSFFARHIPRQSNKMNSTGAQAVKNSRHTYIFSGVLRNVRLRFTQALGDRGQKTKIIHQTKEVVRSIDITIDDEGMLSWKFSQ